VVFAPAAPWSAVFITATSAATFTMASSAAFVVAALSAATFATVAFSATVAGAETSLAVEADLLPPDLPGAINAAKLWSGCAPVATLGACCPNRGVHWQWTHHYRLISSSSAEEHQLLLMTPLYR
jgi:hypothetical protein